MPAPAVFEEAVRPYQTPQNSPTQLYLSQYNISPNQPIFITPGFGSGTGQLPPIQTGSGHYELSYSRYMDQAAVEQSQKDSGF